MRVVLDQLKQFLGALQRCLVPKRLVKFRQRINVKRLTVDFLGIINHLA